ncbi:hypothetical protein AB4Y36_03585 [Paraburkholderia sp. BR10936]|uniref:hypothetical protein n=1 Tax=Paraburkholderia sp. BR10936 TaxID=3236993 RepID=UPI0034D34900
MTTTYTFTLVSHQDSAPEPALVNGWNALFYPLNEDSFRAIQTHLDQFGLWLTQSNAYAGSTGDFYDLTGQFNNYGGFPVSYSVDFDRAVGPSVDPSLGMTHYGQPRNSTLAFGNNAGFLQGSYPTSFTMNSARQAAPYTVSIAAGTQSYSKSDPRFTIPYGIYNCPGTWSIESDRAVCSVAATYRYSYDNVGTLSIAGTQTQQLGAYTNVGYCAAQDGAGTVAVFTDKNGAIAMTTESYGNDAAALAYVAQQYGSALPNNAQGFLRIDVSQDYNDRLTITHANDGIFDWATLPQEVEARTTWASLLVSSPMGTQALYTINSSQS